MRGSQPPQRESSLHRHLPASILVSVLFLPGKRGLPPGPLIQETPKHNTSLSCPGWILSTMLLNLLTPSEKLVGFSGSLDVSLFPCGLWTCPHPCSVALQVFKMSIAQTCRSAPAAVLKPCWRRCPGRRPGPEHALPTGALEGDRPGNYTTTPQHGDVCSWALPDQKQPPHPVNHFFEMCKNEMGKNMFPIVVTKIGTQT